MKSYDQKVQSFIDKLHNSKQKPLGKRITSLLGSISKEEKAALLLRLKHKK